MGSHWHLNIPRSRKFRHTSFGHEFLQFGVSAWNNIHKYSIIAPGRLRMHSTLLFTNSKKATVSNFTLYNLVTSQIGRQALPYCCRGCRKAKTIEQSAKVIFLLFTSSQFDILVYAWADRPSSMNSVPGPNNVITSFHCFMTSFSP
jgi:hypothetical protein